MDAELADRVALVTGAGSPTGIGFATAKILGREGAAVALCSTTDRIHDRAAELHGGHMRAAGFVADLTDRAQVREMVDAVVEAFGRIDVLVNNAGMVHVGMDGQPGGPFLELSDADWDRPSLCTGWTVRDVVAHMISTANMTPPKFLGKMVGSGFSFQAMTRKEIAREKADRSNSELVEALRARIEARTAPPGPAQSWLGETIVHGEDVFRALGGYRDLRLMEDLDFSQRLKARGRSVLVDAPVVTSGRRFLARGPWRTFFFIVWLLARWTLGLDTERYAERWRR